MKARCDDESAKAQSARDALVAMLAEGDVRVDNVSLDKYGGRVLADASTRSVQNVSQALSKLLWATMFPFLSSQCEPRAVVDSNVCESNHAPRSAKPKGK